VRGESDGADHERIDIIRGTEPTLPALIGVDSTILSPGNERVFIGSFGDFPVPDGGRSSLRETLVAKITSIATILASPDIGQTRVAEVGLESGFYR
jgi:hypothetical protein